MRPVRWAVTVLVLSLLAVSCSRDAEFLDRAATERSVAEAVADSVELGIDRVRCPGEIPRGSGETVMCTVRFDDATRALTVAVRQRDGAGRLEVTFRQAVVDPADIATDLRRTLIDRFGRAFLVDCGEAGPVVVNPGHHVSCKARDRSGPKAIDGTVIDVAGTMRYRIG